MLRILTTLILAAAAGPVAAAACPDRSDLQRGIFLKTDDGNTELHRDAGQGWTRVQVAFADGGGSVLDYWAGIYLQRSVPVEDGQAVPSETETYGSRAAIAAWLVPQPEHQWINTRAGGGMAASGPVREVRIGNCRYPAFEVVIRFGDDPNYRETYSYLPDLGIGLLILTDDGETRDKVRYTAIAAR